MPEVPESVREPLQNVRDTLHLRWNNIAVPRQGAGFDACGIATSAGFDPRWELWDTDPDGQPYQVMTLQHPDGSFRPPGQWLVELIRYVDPAKWDGDPARMIRALVDDKNRRLEQVSDEDFDDFSEMVSKWGGWMATPKARVLTDLQPSEAN